MTNKEFIKLIENDLMNISYFRNKNLFLHQFSDDIYGVLSFGFSSFRKGKVNSIFPYAGIRSNKIEEIGMQLWEKKKTNNYIEYTLGKGLLYLVPASLSNGWWIYEPSQIKPIIDDIYKNIINYALPWIEKMTNIDEMIKYLKEDIFYKNEHFDTLLIIYYLQGNYEEAMKLLEEKEKNNPFLDISDFFTNFRELINSK